MSTQTQDQAEINRAGERAAHVCRIALTASLPGLLIQYLLGMYINLYLPRLHAQAPLIAHIILGAALVATAGAATVTAIISRRRHYIVVSVVGLITLAVGATGGIRFLARGQHNGDSYLMALGFILATATYGIGLRAINRQLHQRELELLRTRVGTRD